MAVAAISCRKTQHTTHAVKSGPTCLHTDTVTVAPCTSNHRSICTQAEWARLDSMNGVLLLQDFQGMTAEHCWTATNNQPQLPDLESWHAVFHSWSATPLRNGVTKKNWVKPNPESQAPKNRHPPVVSATACLVASHTQGCACHPPLPSISTQPHPPEPTPATSTQTLNPKTRHQPVVCVSVPPAYGVQHPVPPLHFCP